MKVDQKYCLIKHVHINGIRMDVLQDEYKYTVTLKMNATFTSYSMTTPASIQITCLVKRIVSWVGTLD